MNSERLRVWLWTSAALVAGLLLRLWFVVHWPRAVGDSLVYGDIAKSWLRHGIYGLSIAGPAGARPTLIRLPGYPIFLATCFRLFGMDHYRAVLNVQVAVDLLTCCLAGAAAGRLFGDRSRLTVLWIAALCPFTANYTSTALAETLTLFTMALAFYAFIRWQEAGLGYNMWLWVIAAALSCSILLRPEQGLFAASILPAMLWKALNGRESLGPLCAPLPVVAAALCVALPFVPWTIRNESTFHVFQPLAPRSATDPGETASYPGFGRWYRTWAIDFAATDEIAWPMDGEPIDFASLPRLAFDAATPAQSDGLRRQTAALFADYNNTLVLTPALDARFGRLADELIQAHPLRYSVGLRVARLLDMAFRPRTEMLPVPDEWWQWSRHPAQSAFAWAWAALNLAFFLGAFAGLSAWKRSGWRSPFSSQIYPELAVAMGASILLRSALLLFIDNAEPRYTLEFYPIFFIWIGALFASTPEPTVSVADN